MTMPDERSRGLVWAGGFLIELARDKRLPMDIRKQAVVIARHFPTVEQVGHLASTIESSTSPFGLGLAHPKDHPEWAAECRHGPLKSHTNLAWPSSPEDGHRLMPSTERFHPSLDELSAARRLQLAAEWPTADEAGLAMGLDSRDASRVVEQHRCEGRLLGAYMVEPEHHWRYPIWQFDYSHQPIARLADVLAVLRRHGSYLHGRGGASGWREVEWFHSPHALLDGRRPCEVLREDPDAVLEAARVEYIEECSDGGF